jgi:hypothetical protein
MCSAPSACGSCDPCHPGACSGPQSHHGGFDGGHRERLSPALRWNCADRAGPSASREGDPQSIRRTGIATTHHRSSDVDSPSLDPGTPRFGAARVRERRTARHAARSVGHGMAEKSSMDILPIDRSAIARPSAERVLRRSIESTQLSTTMLSQIADTGGKGASGRLPAEAIVVEYVAGLFEREHARAACALGCSAAGGGDRVALRASTVRSETVDDVQRGR